MTANRYGLDPDDPLADVLDELYRERYGDPRKLQRERAQPPHRQNQHDRTSR